MNDIMKRVTEPDAIRLQHSIVTLGKFDGFHLGHQKLLEEAVRLKYDGLACPVVIFTFQVHPGRLLEHREIQTIQTQKERELYAYPDGVDYVIEFPFNRETMSMLPEEFVREILVDRLGARAIVCGEDFRFGKNRSGSMETLRALGREYGFEVVVVPKVTVRWDPEGPEMEISSTRIKEEIRKGHLEHAAAMLGRPYSITAEVEHGKRLGRTIGFPTLNQTVPEHKLLPPDGVYATRTTILEERPDDAGQEPLSWVTGITNIGRRPTFDDGEARTVETHLFAFHRDLYGKTVTVELCHFIRPERKFADVRALQEQMTRDRASAEKYFQMESSV